MGSEGHGQLSSTGHPAALVPEPTAGRIYRAERRIRLSDMAASGRLRLDAVARYLQDIATDDVADAGVEDADHVWVVRRTVLEVCDAPAGDQSVRISTWASGIGARWATRRTRLVGATGGRIDAESLWVHVNRSTQRPERLPHHFLDVYGQATVGRQVSGKLFLPAQAPADAVWLSWPLRITDIDILGHVNNAAYWEAIESVFVAQEQMLASCRAVMEYRQPIDFRPEIAVGVTHHASTSSVWFTNDGPAAATASVVALSRDSE
jgi:acyl-ACP thioesterase